MIDCTSGNVVIPEESLPLEEGEHNPDDAIVECGVEWLLQDSQELVLITKPEDRLHRMIAVIMSQQFFPNHQERIARLIPRIYQEAAATIASRNDDTADRVDALEDGVCCCRHLISFSFLAHIISQSTHSTNKLPFHILQYYTARQFAIRFDDHCVHSESKRPSNFTTRHICRSNW